MPARAKLAAILDALEMQGDKTRAFLDRRTGDVVVLSDEELSAAEDSDDVSDYPEWQRDSIEQARLVSADDGSRFVALPDRFEINKWEMMRDFALSREDENVSGVLLDAIHGRGAFRYFKDRVKEKGLTENWHVFRTDRYRQIAVDWCEAHGLELDTDA